MLGRHIKVQLVIFIVGKEVIGEVSSRDKVFELFRHIGLVRQMIEHVTAPAVFADPVPVERDLALAAWLMERVEAEGGVLHLHHLAKAVAIGIIRPAVPQHGVDIPSRFAVVADYGRVHVQLCVSPRIGAFTSTHVNRSNPAFHIERISGRLPGDDVDRSGNGISPEEGRAAAAHYFHPFHHVGGDQFESIYTRQSAEDRSAVQ